MRRTVLSGRFVRSWLITFLACLGVVSAGAGLIEALFDKPFAPHGAYYLSAALAGCFAGATLRTWPRLTFSRHFPVPGTTIIVTVGDLFDQEGHLVIGTTDTFDTDTHSIIAKQSIQAQLLEREYRGDAARLDADLERALRPAVPLRVEERRDRPQGKLVRYPIGTVATIGIRGRRYFCTAYSTLNNDNYGRSSIDDLWKCLSATWEAVRRHGERQSISVPVIGAGLARIGNISRTDLIRLIIISYLANSRESVVADRLRVVIHPAHAEELNLREIEDFLSVQ
ncbi:macro domain-containing protein [Nonomuraea sp. NPDC004186]